MLRFIIFLSVVFAACSSDKGQETEVVTMLLAPPTVASEEVEEEISAISVHNRIIGDFAWQMADQEWSLSFTENSLIRTLQNVEISNEIYEITRETGNEIALMITREDGREVIHGFRFTENGIVHVAMPSQEFLRITDLEE